MPNRKTKCFIEIKKKYKGLVSKRRIMAPLERADAYLAGQDDLENVQSMNHQMLHEMDYFRSVYPVIPKLYLSYERKALFGKEDPEFRVTFDKNITVRRYDLELDKGVYGRVLMDDCHLMEVKVLGAVPLWFARLLSKYSIFPTSFSKYGTEYIYVASAFVNIRMPNGGCINLGDGFVLLAGLFLGPIYGTAAAAVGSLLCDLLAGYTMYAPGTAVIKDHSC